MEIPLAITVLAGVLLYGVIFLVVGIRRGSAAAMQAEDEAPALESVPQRIQKKNPQPVDGRMSRRAEYANDLRFGGNKVISLPFGSEEAESQQAQNNK